MKMNLRNKLKTVFVSALCLFTPSFAFADEYCPGSSERCEDGWTCAQVAEYDEEEDPDNPLQTNGDVMCYSSTGSGSEYYLVGDFLVSASDITSEDQFNYLGELGYGYSTTIVYAKSPMPLTDAILPLSLALLAYGYVMKRRKK